MTCRLSQVVIVASSAGRVCHLMFARNRVGLWALLFLLVVGVGMALKPPTVEAQTSADFTVQIAARLNPDGRVEFGLRLLDLEGRPGERMTGSERFFPRQLDHHRWLNASPIEIAQPSAARHDLDEVARVRIVARIHPTRNQIEFGLQHELPEWDITENNDRYSERIYPSKRFWPDRIDHHRWLYTSDIAFTVHYREFFETMSEAGTLGQVPSQPGPIPSETVNSCVSQIAEDAEAMVAGQCEELLVEYCESHQENSWCRQLITSRAEAERLAQGAAKNAPTAEEIAEAEAERKLSNLVQQCWAGDFPYGEQVHEECDPIMFQHCERDRGDRWCIATGYLEPLPSALQADEQGFSLAVYYCRNRVINLGRDMGTVCDALFQESCERDRLPDFCTDLGYVELGPADYHRGGTPIQQCVYWVQALDLPIDPHCRDILQDDCDHNRLEPLCAEHGLVELVPADYLPYGTEVDQCWNWVLREGMQIDPHCRTILQVDCDQMVAQWWFYEGCVNLGLSEHPQSEQIQTLRIDSPGVMEADDGSLEAEDGSLLEDSGTDSPDAPSESNDDYSSMAYVCPEDPTFMCDVLSKEPE